MRLLSIIMLSVGLAGMATGQNVYLAEDAVWRYANATAASTLPSIPANWSSFTFDDTTWSQGNGPFGLAFGPTLPAPSGTTWPATPQVNSGGITWHPHYDPLARTRFILPDARPVTLWMAVDHGVREVWLNGVRGDVVLVDQAPAQRWEYRVDVPAQYVAAGENVLAVALDDDGAGTAFVMVVTDDDPAVNPLFSTLPPAISDVSVKEGRIAATPEAPDVSEATTVRVTALNQGELPALVRGRLFLGDPSIPSANAVQVGSVTRTVNAYGGEEALDFNWIPSTEGVAELFVVLENLTFVESNLSNNRASRVVNVGAPPVRLEMQAAEAVGWPGAELEVPLTIQNRGAGATTLLEVNFPMAPDPNAWATVQAVPGGAGDPIGAVIPSGGSLAILTRLNIPAMDPRFAGLPAPGAGPPGLFYIPVQVRGRTGSLGNFEEEVFSGQLIVKMFGGQVAIATIEVVDQATQGLLPGSLVTVQGLPGTYQTDGSGTVQVPLPYGPRGFFAFKDGYVATAVNETITLSAQTVRIELEAGQTLAVSQVTQRQLSTPEILARGIDPNQIGNNVIYDFVVRMRIGPPVYVPSVQLPPPPVSGPPVTTTVSRTCAGSNCGTVTISLNVTQFPGPTPRRVDTWIIIPGRVTVLRKFYEATVFVENRSVAPNPSDVQLRNLEVSLDPIAGLGRPDLNGMPQPTVVQVPVLNAGECHLAQWILRGDIPGTYRLTGRARADLYAFGAATGVTLDAFAQSDPFQVVLPDLRLSFITPTAVFAGCDFRFGVVVTNQSTAVAQLVRVALKAEDLVNCSLSVNGQAPGTPSPICPGCVPDPGIVFRTDPATGQLLAELTLGDIEPGASAVANFCLTSHVTGRVLEVETRVWSTTNVTPPAIVAEGYPGSGSDALVLWSGIDEPPSPINLGFVRAGQLVNLSVISLDGTLAGQPFLLAATLRGNSPARQFPGTCLWLDLDPSDPLGSLIFIVGPTPSFPLGPPLPCTPGGMGCVSGFSLPAFPWIAGYAGTRFTVQAAGFGPQGMICTDAHEFRVVE